MIGFRTDGMQQETTVGFQITIDHIKIGGVIFRPDMFGTCRRKQYDRSFRAGRDSPGAGW